MSHEKAAALDFDYLYEIDTIEVNFLGGTIYIAGENEEGLPNPVSSITWIESSGRFSNPEYIREGDDLYCSDPVSGNWTILALNVRPRLNVTTAGSEKGYSKTGRREAMDQVDSFFSNNPEEAQSTVFLHYEFQRNDGLHFRELGYSDSSEVQVVAVFVFYDGSMSLASDPKTILFDKSFEYDIGFTVMTHKDLLAPVSHIRIYRKILDGGVTSSGNYDLLFTAAIFDEDVHEETYDVSVDSGYCGDKLLFTTSSGYEELNDAWTLPDEENIGIKVTDDGGDTWEHRASNNYYWKYGYKITSNSNDVTLKVTAGWMKPDVSYDDLRAYAPPHFYAEGDLEFKCIWRPLFSDTQLFHISVTMEESIYITDRYPTAQEYDSPGIPLYENEFEKIPAMIVGSKAAPPYTVYETGSNGAGFKMPYTHEVYGGHPAPGAELTELLAGRGVFKCGVRIAESYGLPDNATADIVAGGNAPNGDPSFGETFPLFRDSANPSFSPTLEEELGGTDIENIAEINPRHIGIAGGRLFGLNITMNGVHESSKLVYSEFGKFSSFRIDNYIDYGVRDDGEGVGISALKSYVIAHHSSSTYVIDVSGGSDFAWREVGAYTDAGCISNDLIAITPFGVFWCSYNHMWLFTGSRPIPISDEIVNTYRRFARTAYKLSYKEDLKQIIMFSEGNNALVYDIEERAWHTHNFEEMSADDKTGSLFSVEGSIYLSHYSNGNIGHSFRVFERDSDEHFTWGFNTGDISMGAPEVIKKIKRLYLNTVLEDTSSTPENIRINAVGDQSGNVTIDEDIINGGQLRRSVSVKGYFVNLDVKIDRSSFWRGSLDSLGLSYKMKKLK